MQSPRNLWNKLHLEHRLKRRPRKVRNFGVTLPTDPDLLPEYVIDLIYRKRYEAHEAEICQRELRAGDRTLELGAGIGFIGSLAAKICGPGNVRSYEANVENESTIRRTHQLNRVAPDLRMQAVASRNGSITFYRNDNVISSSLVDRNFGGKTTVEAVALADVIADFRPNVIVCDIEGAEVEVFAAADLSGVDRILIELHPKIVGEHANERLLSTFQAQGLEFEYGNRSKVTFLKRRR